ncbi:hypothetical protein EDD29_4281 [Actinocorallia herbida]|uniref:Uncharacterized protein n=2 Tax=Actinocorallia herbida TaxID=58109 RepID=A0A3N1CZI5_9ACTN|nr:hypothetical protein EDD29_4281 [Actinocorallia herbida]
MTAVCVLALGLLTGCGGGDGGSKVATLSTDGPSGATASAAPGDADQARAFTQCLRDNGIQIDDPDPKTGRLDRDSLGGVDEAKAGKALEACRDLMPQQNEALAALQNPDAETKAKMVDFAQCMRDAGHDFPDPGPDGFDFTELAGGGTDEGLRDDALACLKEHPFADLGGLG